MPWPCRRDFLMCSWSTTDRSVTGLDDWEELHFRNIHWSFVSYFLLSVGYWLELVILLVSGPFSDCLTCNSWIHSYFPAVVTYLKLGFPWFLWALYCLRCCSLAQCSSFFNCFLWSLWNKNAPYSIIDLINAYPPSVLFKFTILIGFSHFVTVLISSSQSRLHFK